MGGLHDKVLETFESLDGFTAFGNDTLNLALTNRRVRGAKAATFDKVNGAAGSKLAAIGKTVDLKLDEEPPWHRLLWNVYLSALTNVDYAFLRLGSTDANYVEYRVLVAALVAARFTQCTVPMAEFAAFAGTGCDFSNVDYLAVGVAFASEANALAGIVIDRLSIVPTRHDA